MPAAHARYTGAASLVVADLDGGDRAGRRSCSPTCRQHNDEEPPRWPTDDPPDRPTPEAGALMPHDLDRAATTCAT